MANDFKNTSLVTRVAVKEFINALMLGRKVDRQFENSFHKKGDTISIRRPVMFTSSDGATLGSASDIEEANVPLVLDKRKKVHFEVTSQDLTLKVEDFTSRYVRPAMIELAQQVESDLAAEYKNIYNFSGTPGTSPGTFLSVALAGAELSKIGVPETEPWCAFFDANASVTLADGLKTVFPQDIAKRAIERASVGQYGGFDIFKNNSLKTHTVGIATGTPRVNGASQNTTYNSSGDAWVQALATDGWTNSQTGILKAGDVFTIAGVNSVNIRTCETTGDLQNFVVTADANSGASTGPATLTISPPIITSGPYQTVDAAPADNAAITVKTGAGGASHRQNLGFHKNAITLAMVNLDVPQDGVSASIENHDGISIRVARQFDITNDKTIYRFDILYGIKTQNPAFAVRITS